MCATSLKSNNAALAKKVAELQLELNAQRTSAREAAIESCKLQMQVARLQPLVEARSRLKDSMLQLRELMATMLDTDMAVLRCVNEMASVIEGPGDGEDQSICGNTNWWADTVLEMTNLLNLDRTARDASRVAPSPILPPVRRRQPPMPRPQEPTPVSLPPTTTQGIEFPCVTTEPRASHLSVSPAALDPARPAKQSPMLGSPQSPPGSQFIRPPPPVPLSPAVGSQNSTVPPAASESATVAPVEPEFTANYSPVEPITPQPPLPACSPVSSDSLQSHGVAVVQPDQDSRAGQGRRPQRQARLKSRPIVDLSSSHVLDSPERSGGKEAKQKHRRRRLVLADDDDDDFVGEFRGKQGSNRSKRPTKSKKATVTRPGIQTAESNEKSAPEPQGRVVEVKFAKPGRVAFRADAKHAPSTLARANEPFESERDAGVAKPKSVFDLPTDQTINMSVLPATLDELRQREHAKKNCAKADEAKPVDPPASARAQETDNNQARDRHGECHSPSMQSEKRLSIVLSPLRSVPANGADLEKPRPVLVDQNQSSKRRFRRLLLDHDSDDENAQSENRPCIINKATSVISSSTTGVLPKSADTPATTVGSARSKRAHKT